MKSKKTLFIHIGTNKTGTSAIQLSLNGKRKELAEKGLLYPSAGCAGDAHYDISRILGFDHGKQPAPDAERAAFLGRFEAEVEASRCETCVISSENFVLPKNVELVRSYFTGFDCRIIVYFRRHDHWWLSAYSQAVKMVAQPPWIRGFQGFLNFNHRKNSQVGNYRALLDRWEKFFGRENIVVRPYEREQNQPDIIADFLSAIGCADHCSIFSESVIPNVNPSLDARSIFLLETFQRMKTDQNVRQALIDHVLKNADPQRKAPYVSPEIRRRLVDENAQQYDYIARTYLNRPDGALFNDPLPEPDAAWANPEDPTIVEVAEIVAQVLTSPNGRSKSILRSIPPNSGAL
ncbi:MAG: hypothetical protein WAK95_06790 [Desulfobacterales bacterium]